MRRTFAPAGQGWQDQPGTISHSGGWFVLSGGADRRRAVFLSAGDAAVAPGFGGRQLNPSASSPVMRARMRVERKVERNAVAPIKRTRHRDGHIDIRTAASPI